MLLIWIAYVVVKSLVMKGIPENEDEGKEKGIMASAFTALGILIYDALQRNTLNYTLFDKGRRVYEGITLESRKMRRISEHRTSGKRFDLVRFSLEPTYRSDALDLEESRIRQYKPKYNIQHNCQ